MIGSIPVARVRGVITMANHVENQHTSSEVDYVPKAVVDLAGIILSSMNYSITLVVLNPCREL